MTIKGTSGNDVRNGTAGNDVFRLWQGGDDTANGFGGKDLFRMRGALSVGDALDGGGGYDRVVLKGDYSAGLVFGAATIVNIEVLRLGGAFDYNLTLDDGNVDALGHLTIFAGRLGAGHSLTFDGSAETDGHLKVFASAGDDTLIGGAKGDAFRLAKGGVDSAYGGGGQDKFILGGALTAADTIDGGGGTDMLRLAGNYAGAHAVVFGANTVTNIERMFLSGGHSYDLTTHDATVAAGKMLIVDASALGAGDTLTFDGSAETDGFFVFYGGAGDDKLTGSALGDYFGLAGGGDDRAYGGGGDDPFVMGAALTAADTIDGGDGNDNVWLDGDYSAGIVFGAATLTNVEVIVLAAGNSYDLTTHDNTVGGGKQLLVDASTLGAGDSLTFDGSAETDGSFLITGGAGDDHAHRWRPDRQFLSYQGRQRHRAWRRRRRRGLDGRHAHRVGRHRRRRRKQRHRRPVGRLFAAADVHRRHDYRRRDADRFGGQPLQPQDE